MTKFDELIRLTLILNQGHINQGEKQRYYNENADDIKKKIIRRATYVSGPRPDKKKTYIKIEKKNRKNKKNKIK